MISSNVPSNDSINKCITGKFLKVAIDVPINQLFHYLPNDEPFSVGQYVTIPFGRRKLIGVIYEISSNSDIHPSKLKSVTLFLLYIGCTTTEKELRVGTQVPFSPIPT